MKKMKRIKKGFIASACLLSSFILWTALVRLVDVRAIGPQGSTVGFASFNQLVHDLTDVDLSLYTLTDWLGLFPVCICMGFGVLGLCQWIRRKSLRRVDRSLLVLGGFYVVVMLAYLLFEAVVVNYRPVLIDGYLEASYPSSTTLLVSCVMPTAAMQLNERIKSDALRRCAVVSFSVFTAFTVIGRLLSGVHWITDIVGGVLLGAGLVIAYYSVNGLIGAKIIDSLNRSV